MWLILFVIIYIILILVFAHWKNPFDKDSFPITVTDLNNVTTVVGDTLALNHKIAAGISVFISLLISLIISAAKK